MSRARRGILRVIGGLLHRNSTQAWIALFSALGVVLIALVDADRTMPGPLSSVHDALEELENGNDCSSCHGGLFSDMTDSCLDCHGPIDAQLADGGGLHGIMPPEQARSCALCHSEHHGGAFKLVNLNSFRRAGIEDPAQFDHAVLGFQMEGRHLELTCSECHANAEVDLLEAGEHRFMGLEPNCARCHDDPHKGRMVRSCEDCHSQTDFNDLHASGHEQRLNLVGGHGDLECRTCHAEEEEHSLESLARGLVNRRARTCADCHATPHAEKFIKGVAQRVGSTPGNSCSACHLDLHTSFQGDGSPNGGAADLTLEPMGSVKGLQETMTPKLHAASGFRLVKPHRELDCADCHDTAALDYGLRFPGRKQGGCSVCHEDPHGGQFAKGQFAGRECTACHQKQRFDPPQFDLEAHNRTSFPLEGSHVTADCNGCHLVPEGEDVRVFHGTPGRCELCHADAHSGFFDEALANLPHSRKAGACSECHLSTSFDDVLLEEDQVTGKEERPAGRPFDHGQWTDFILRGAHAQESCEICHAPSEQADDLGRRFGRVEDHFGAAESCSSCHQDPHGGEFDRKASLRRFRKQEGCQRCHGESSFRSLPHGFDHELWTDFELNGVHSEADCEACHAPLREPTATGRTWSQARGSNCGDCHAEPHAGQFKKDGVTDCTRCHRSAEGWDILRFNHDRHSRFPLGESHADVECSACHPAWELESGAEIVRYRPLDSSCAACHGSQKGPTLRGRGKKRN